MNQILIKSNGLEFTAELYDTPTAKAISQKLPLKGNAHVWGDEVYFEIPLSFIEEPDAREIVEKGELAFWSPGSAFCIFFGPTPVSQGNEPRAYSPVNVFGKIEGDLSGLKEIHSGEVIEVVNIK